MEGTLGLFGAGGEAFASFGNELAQVERLKNGLGGFDPRKVEQAAGQFGQALILFESLSPAYSSELV